MVIPNIQSKNSGKIIENEIYLPETENPCAEQRLSLRWDDPNGGCLFLLCHIDPDDLDSNLDLDTRPHTGKT